MKQLLDELWAVKDKELAALIKDTNFQYYLGNITKKEYEIRKEGHMGFYFGWRCLYYDLIKHDETIRGVITVPKSHLEQSIEFATQMVEKEKQNK
jgi:hypothetical protein